MTDINVGQLSEAINEKMYRDGSNIASPKLSVFLVDVQYPTAENDYTWYRLYSDGWVEQGGTNTITQTTITLPVPMADATYSGQITCNQGGSFFYAFVTKTMTSITIRSHNKDNTQASSSAMWQVSGMSGSSSNNSSSGGSSGGSSGSGGGTPDPTPGDNTGATK